MEALPGQRVEVVRGRLAPDLSQRLVEFWIHHRVLDEPEARRRLAQVVCVLLADDGRVLGVNTVYPDTAPLVGRRFWMYRRFLAPGAAEGAELAMLKAARDELAPGFTAAEGEPLGICVLFRDRALIERHREAVLPEIELLFAGYTDGDAQVRIAYFEGARI